MLMPSINLTIMVTESYKHTEDVCLDVSLPDRSIMWLHGTAEEVAEFGRQIMERAIKKGEEKWPNPPHSPSP